MQCVLVRNLRMSAGRDVLASVYFGPLPTFAPGDNAAAVAGLIAAYPILIGLLLNGVRVRLRCLADRPASV